MGMKVSQIDLPVYRSLLGHADERRHGRSTSTANAKIQTPNMRCGYRTRHTPKSHTVLKQSCYDASSPLKRTKSR